MDPVSSGADPTTPLEAFNNATIATGGDSKLYNLNVFYDVSWSRDELLNVGLMRLGGRYRLDDHGHGVGAAYDPRSWVCTTMNYSDDMFGLIGRQVFLLWTCETKVCA